MSFCSTKAKIGTFGIYLLINIVVVPAYSAQKHCDNAPNPTKNLSIRGIYADKIGSVIDNDYIDVYKEAIYDVNMLRDKVIYYADGSWNGDQSDGYCAISLMREWANAKALAKGPFSHQGKTVRTWTLAALSIAYLKVKAKNFRDEVVEKWLIALAQDTLNYRIQRNLKYQGGWSNIDNWIALAVGAAALAADRNDLWLSAENMYQTGIHQIGKDGFITAELKRGQRALQYHSFAGAPLAAVEALSSLNKTNNDMKSSPDLIRLANLIAEGINNRSVFVDRTNSKQIAIGSTAWLGLILPSLEQSKMRGINIAKSDNRLGGNISVLIMTIEALKANKVK